MNYYATGEGQTAAMATARSRNEAELRLKDNIDEYFHRGIVSMRVAEIDVAQNMQFVGVIELCCPPLFKILHNETKFVTYVECNSMIHFNIA